MEREDETFRIGTRRRRTVTIDGLDIILGPEEILNKVSRYGPLVRIYSKPLRRGGALPMVQRIQITFASSTSLEGFMRDKPFGPQNQQAGPIIYNRVNIFGEVWYDHEPRQLHSKTQKQPFIWFWPSPEKILSASEKSISPVDSLWEHYMESQ